MHEREQFPRNDIDVIAVRANCTFTGYEDSSFNGAQMEMPAKNYDRFFFQISPFKTTFAYVAVIALFTFIVNYFRWVVLADSPEFKHMDEDIESLKCFCD